MFNRRYENQLMEYFSSMQAINKLSVLNLGGVSGALGGSGGPPGGIIGQLAQVNVTYDTTEGESLYTPVSGMSLLDNLNHIRYRINTLEEAPGEIEVSEDGTSVISEATVLNFAGDGISVTSSGTTANITISLLELLALSGLSDVSLISVISGESLVYNGSEWINASVQSSSGISSISVEEDGTPVSSSITTLNFTGDVEVTESGGTATINVTTSGVTGATELNELSDVSLITVVSGESLVYNGIEWINSNISVTCSGITLLNELSDVTIVNVVSGELLAFDGSAWINSEILITSSGVTTLDGLDDVSLTTPASGESLVYSGTEWINATIEIPSGISFISVEEDGVPISSAVITLNFTGDIEVTESDGTATINITTSGASGYIVLEETYTNDDLSGLCDGEETDFPTSNTFKSGTTLVYLNGLLQRPGSGNSYLEKEALNGIDFYIPPEVDDELLITYSIEEYPTITEIKIGSETDFTFFDAYGHQTMSGNARPWRDELGELLLKAKNGTRISNNLSEGTVVFSDTCVIADDWVIMNVQLNHDKDLQSELHPHIHYIQTESGVPNWLLQHRWQVNGATTTSGWTSGAWTDLAFDYDDSDRFNQIVAFPSITPPTNVSISDIVQFKIFRDTDNDSGLFDGNDPITGDIEAYMYDVHFQINSLGSDEEYTK